MSLPNDIELDAVGNFAWCPHDGWRRPCGVAWNAVPEPSWLLKLRQKSWGCRKLKHNWLALSCQLSRSSCRNRDDDHHPSHWHDLTRKLERTRTWRAASWCLGQWLARRRFVAALLPRLFWSNIPGHVTRAPTVGFELTTNRKSLSDSPCPLESGPRPGARPL